MAPHTGAEARLLFAFDAALKRRSSTYSSTDARLFHVPSAEAQLLHAFKRQNAALLRTDHSKVPLFCT